MVLVKGGLNPRYLTNANGILFFSADDGAHGRELWTSDGSEAGTVRVKDILPGTGSSDPRDLVAIDSCPGRKSDPLRDQLVSPNNSKRLFILSGESLNG